LNRWKTQSDGTYFGEHITFERVQFGTKLPFAIVIASAGISWRCFDCLLVIVGGSPSQGNDTCSGFLGTGHGGEYVFAVSLHAGGEEVIDLLAAAPTASKAWPALDGGISIIKESRKLTSSCDWSTFSHSLLLLAELGGYLATQNVTLSSEGMTVTANYTLAYLLWEHIYNS